MANSANRNNKPISHEKPASNSNASKRTLLPPKQKATRIMALLIICSAAIVVVAKPEHLAEVIFAVVPTALEWIKDK